MKNGLIGAFTAACVMALVSTGAHAANCNPSKTQADDMTPDQAQAVYDCLKDGLYKGYNKNVGKKRAIWRPMPRITATGHWRRNSPPRLAFTVAGS